MEPDSVNLDEVIDEPNPCLIVMNSQVEDPDNEDTRVRRLQQLAALKDSSSSNDQEKEQGKEEHREKEDDDDSSDEDEVLFVPPSQADELLEEKAPSRANETLLQSFISTPSETVGILHLSGESSRILVPETSDDTLSTQQTSDEAHPIISSSPSDNTLADSSKEETKKEEDEEFQVPEWQRAINASEVEQRVSSSKEVSSASSSSATSESVDYQSSNSAPSLQLLQNWQDPNQVDSSQSLIQQRDFAAQASAPASPQLIIDSQQHTDSVQIIGEVESGKSSRSTTEGGATSGASRHFAEDIHGMENVTSSQDFRLHLTQSQTETEAEGVGVYMDAALKKEGSAGTHRYTLDQVSQTGPFSDNERPHRYPKKHSDPQDISSSGLTSSSEKEKIERLASKEKSSTVESTKPSKSLDADERHVHEEIASKPKRTPQPTIQQLDKSQRSNQEAEQSITSSSIAEVNSKDSLSESNTSQPSGLSFHLNMIKDNSRISPFEAQGGLLNSKKFQHSTPIVSEVEDEDQQGKNSEKEQSKSSSSKSLLTISEQDSIPAETEKEMTFHLNVPSKEEIQAIRESPTRKKVTVFSGIQQASFSKAKQVSLQDEKEESTQDEDPFASEAQLEDSAQNHRHVEEAAYKRPEEHENELPDPLNLNRERENNSSTDTLPVELTAETEHYGMDLDKSVVEDTSRNARTVDHSVAMETEDVAEPRKPSAGKKKGRKRKQRGRGSGSGDARSPSRHSKRKFTEVRDPYQFTDSQSNRVQSPLKQRGDDLMAVASKTKTVPDRLEKRKSPRSSRRRGASSAERERTRAENGVKEGGNKEEQKGDPSSEKENQGGVEQSGSKVTRSETRRNLSFVRQSSSSSSSGHQQHVSRMTLQDDPDMEIKYEVVNIHLKVKKVYIRGVLAHTYTKELSKVVEPAESSESDEWPASPTSSFSGYLGDVSSMGSRSSSNTGSLQKSASIGSKSSSSTTSLGKDSSPAKTPSPQVPPLQTGRSLNRTGSSSSSGKSSHGVVHFSPELESTLAKTSSVGGKDSEFKQPEKSVRKKSVSPKEGTQSEINLSRVTQGESQVDGQMGGLGKDLTKRTKVASVVNVTEETEVQVNEEESLPRKGRREKGEGSSKDKERSRQGLTLDDTSPIVTDSSRLTELPDPEGDKTALESAQAAEDESTWRQSESMASKQTRGRRRRGRRSTRGDGDQQEMSKQDASITESAPGMSGPREAPLEEKEAQKETVAGEAAFEILNSPPINTGPDQTQASTSWSEEILKPGTKVLCKWPQTSFYYPSIIQNWTRDDKYLVLYDDMSKREVARANIVCKEWLSKGQPVFVTTDKDFVDSAIVVGYFKDLKSKTVGYVVEDNRGNSKRVAKTRVLLNKEQATNLMNSSTSSSSDVTLENIISGRRSRRASKKVQSSQVGTQETQGERSATAVTPSPPPPSPQQKRSTRSRSRSNNGTAEKSKASNRGKSKVAEGDPVSHSLMSVQLLEEADSMRLSSGSTPRSGVKRRQEEGSKDRDMPARKKLALGVETGRTQMESVTPRHSPRRVGSSTSSSAAGGPLPRSRVLFKGYAFLLTQVVKSDESQESFTREESHMSTPFNKELAKRQIAAGGGTVLRDLEKAQVFRGKVFLIADTHCRTKKYLLALAAGVPCVSHMWLNESCKTGRIPNFQDYILPAGESCEEDCIVEWHPNRYQIMAGIRVMVISSAKEVLETWRSILMAAGSDVVIQYSSTEIIKEKNFSFDCDVIVTDPSCPRSILRSARELSIPVVSAEWLYQCVINGRKVEYEGSHRYEWDYNGEHD